MFSSSVDGERRAAYLLNMFSLEEELDAAEQQGRAIGRIVFGLVLIGGAYILVDRLHERADPQAAKVIGASWTLAFLAGSIARILTASLSTRPNPFAHRALSFAVPAIGIALLLPLTLHLPVALGIGVGLDGFDKWAQLSLWVSAPAHIAFAILAATRATQLARGTRAISTWQVYVLTLIVSCVPFAIFFFVPPIIIGLTGLAIVPLLDRMERIIKCDGAAPLPTAIVQPR